MKRYTTTITVLAIIFLGLVFGVYLSSGWADEMSESVKQADKALRITQARRQNAEVRLQYVRPIRPKIKAFREAWEPCVSPFKLKDAEKEYAAAVMTVLEREAQAADTGSSEKTLPNPTDYRLGNRMLRVQKLSMSATGKLQNCLCWLGSVQEKLPYCRFDAFSLSGYGSSGAALKVVLVHPIPSNKPKLLSPSVQPSTPSQ